MTALILHPTSLSLLPLSTPSSTPPTPSPTPLALPSRFPATASPRATTGPTGHVYLYASTPSPVVWEYDARGRRIGELTTPSGSGGVARVCASGKWVVLVCGKDEARVMKRAGNGGKWACARVLEMPPGDLTSVVGDGDVMAFCAADEVRVYDLESGSTLAVSGGVETPVTCAPVVRLHGTPHLVAPSADGGMTAYPIDNTDATPKTFALGLDSGVRDVSVLGPQAAVASESTHGDVAIVSLNDETPAAHIRLGAELAGIAWLDAGVLAARTVAGMLLVHTLRTGVTSEVKVEQSVLGLYAVPDRHAKTTGATPAARVLAESNLANSAPAPKRTSATKETTKEKRIVSAPTRTDIEVTPLNPARSSGHSGAPATRSISTASTVRIRPIAEADETAYSPAPSVAGGGYGYSQSQRVVQEAGGVGSSDAPTWEAFEEMRREIANLQLDMLRMGRGLKNEIRSAISPLVDELRSSRETIARQAAEIERLRRGY